MSNDLMSRVAGADATKTAILAHIARTLDAAAATAGVNTAVLDLLRRAQTVLAGVDDREWWALYGADGSEAAARKLLNRVGNDLKTGTWQPPQGSGRIGR